ncbi:hypothetical protein RCL1_005463 [Eukaryota sp. TZLM3-RCL]
MQRSLVKPILLDFQPNPIVRTTLSAKSSSSKLHFSTSRTTVRPKSTATPSKIISKPKKTKILDGFAILNTSEALDPAHVKYVSLSSKGYSSCNTEDFHFFSNLITIDVRDNSLSLQDLLFLPHLQCLLLSCNLLTSISVTSLYSSLKILDLSYNFLTGTCFDSLNNFPNLIQLDLSFNQITEIPGYFSLSKLNLLVLDGNKLNCHVFNSLINCKSLKELSVARNRISAVSNVLPSLEALSLAFNQISNQDDVILLSNYQNLKYLSFEGNPLTSLCFSFLSQFKSRDGHEYSPFKSFKPATIIELSKELIDSIQKVKKSRKKLMNHVQDLVNSQKPLPKLCPGLNNTQTQLPDPEDSFFITTYNELTNLNPNINSLVTNTRKQISEINQTTFNALVDTASSKIDKEIGPMVAREVEKEVLSRPLAHVLRQLKAELTDPMLTMNLGQPSPKVTRHTALSSLRADQGRDFKRKTATNIVELKLQAVEESTVQVVSNSSANRTTSLLDITQTAKDLTSEKIGNIVFSSVFN